MPQILSKERVAQGNADIGGAWLSSTQVVRRWVKNRKEVQPSCLVAIVKFGTLNRMLVINKRNVGMTLSHHAPYALDDTRATMVETKSRSFSINSNISSASMILLGIKSEVLLFSCHFHSSSIRMKSFPSGIMNLRLFVILKKLK